MEGKIFMIRHSTQFREYRRAGMVFGQESKPYELTDEQFEILIKDPRIIMHEVQTKGGELTQEKIEALREKRGIN